MHNRIALFGESEKGVYQKPYLCSSLPQLIDTIGNPPESSLGIAFAIQTLLFDIEVLYFRVEEEGFGIKDYMLGFKALETLAGPIHAICLPGVGDKEILDATEPLCSKHKSILITTEKDLFDYLTSSN